MRKLLSYALAGVIAAGFAGRAYKLEVDVATPVSKTISVKSIVDVENEHDVLKGENFLGIVANSYGIRPENFPTKQDFYHARAKKAIEVAVYNVEKQPEKRRFRLDGYYKAVKDDGKRHEFVVGADGIPMDALHPGDKVLLPGVKTEVVETKNITEYVHTKKLVRDTRAMAWGFVSGVGLLAVFHGLYAFSSAAKRRREQGAEDTEKFRIPLTTVMPEQVAEEMLDYQKLSGEFGNEPIYLGDNIRTAIRELMAKGNVKLDDVRCLYELDCLLSKYAQSQEPEGAEFKELARFVGEHRDLFSLAEYHVKLIKQERERTSAARKNTGLATIALVSLLNHGVCQPYHKAAVVQPAPKYYEMPSVNVIEKTSADYKSVKTKPAFWGKINMADVTKKYQEINASVDGKASVEDVYKQALQELYGCRV